MEHPVLSRIRRESFVPLGWFAPGLRLRVLPDWAPQPAIVHAVFPSRRGLSPAVRRFLDYLGESMPGRSSQISRQALEGVDGSNI